MKIRKFSEAIPMMAINKNMHVYKRSQILRGARNVLPKKISNSVSYGRLSNKSV